MANGAHKISACTIEFSCNVTNTTAFQILQIVLPKRELNKLITRGHVIIFGFGLMMSRFSLILCTPVIDCSIILETAEWSDFFVD